jgi:RNA polymerase-binding transcription factor DksA
LLQAAALFAGGGARKGGKGFMTNKKLQKKTKVIAAKKTAAIAKSPVAQADEVVALKQVKWSAAEKKEFQTLLTTLRDRAEKGVQFLAHDNLQLVSTGQASLNDLVAALHRLQLGTYGACELCHELIAKARLQAHPCAKLCIKCQSQAERGKLRYRPAGRTLTQIEELSEE